MREETPQPPPQVQRDPAWWLRSKTLTGAAILAGTILLSKVRGAPVAPTDQAAVDLADALLAALGLAFAVWGRVDAQQRLRRMVDFSDAVLAARAAGPDAQHQARDLYNHETSNAGQATAAAATVPSASGDSTTGAAPEPAGSGAADDELPEYRRPVHTPRPPLAEPSPYDRL